MAPQQRALLAGLEDQFTEHERRRVLEGGALLEEHEQHWSTDHTGSTEQISK